MGRKKLTIKYIAEQFAKEGYELLTKEYINCEGKLDYICPNGHEHSVTWINWYQGKRCPYCYGNVKLTIEFIRAEFEKEGYKLLTKEYINNRQKLEYSCPNGHKYSITWSNWCGGARCPCFAGRPPITIGIVRRSFEEEGYKLLNNEYVNAQEKLKYRCSEGHERSITWNGWQQGQRCSTCFFVNNSGPNHPNWKGGISCEPYCDVWLDKDFKESIKERDNCICQNPDCWGTSERLTIHHIDYVKKNCDPNNLITLCTSCNARANKDREWHTSYYKEIVRRRNLDNEI